MRFISSIFAAALSLAVLQPAIVAQAPDAHLSAVLAQLDAASDHFTNARADFVWDYYEAVVKDTTSQNGSIYFQRNKSSMQMGAVVMDPKVKGPDKVIEYKDGMLQLFDPHLDQIRLMKAGSNQAQYESFLTLGFGGSGKALAQAWNITDLGTETLTDAGQPVKTEKLELVSKDPSARNTFTKVTIWVDPVRGVSLKQVFDTPSHDRRTAVYSHIKLNGKIDTGTFAIKANSKTARVGP